jgi:hypothetical protein
LAAYIEVSFYYNNEIDGFSIEQTNLQAVNDMKGNFINDITLNGKIQQTSDNLEYVKGLLQFLKDMSDLGYELAWNIAARDSVYQELVNELLDGKKFKILVDYLDSENSKIDFTFTPRVDIHYSIKDSNLYYSDNLFKDGHFIYDQSKLNFLNSFTIKNNPFKLIKDTRFSSYSAPEYYLYDSHNEIPHGQFITNIVDYFSYSVNLEVGMYVIKNNSLSVNSDSRFDFTYLADIFQNTTQEKYNEIITSMTTTDGRYYNGIKELLITNLEKMKKHYFNKELIGDE